MIREWAKKPNRRLRVLGAGVALLLAAPAAGDWLVLRDGTRLETAGPWDVKGRQVVFTRPDGSLAALRLADVDLESSAEATDASQQAAAKPPPVTRERGRRRSVLTLTDDDLRPEGAGSEVQDETEPVYDQEDAPQDGEGEDGDSDGDQETVAEPAVVASTAAGDQPVTVVSWREQESSEVDGLEIVGTVRNRGRDVAADIQVQVKVPDEDGNPLVDTRAFLERSSLAPGRTGTFRALLPGMYALLEDPTFTVTSEGFTLGLAKEAAEGSEGYLENYGFTEPADDLEDFAEPVDPEDFAEPIDPEDEEGGGSG